MERWRIVGLEMAISGKSKIKKLVAMGANLRPDSTAVNSWAVKEVLQSKKMIKIQRKTLLQMEFTKQLLGLLEISQIFQLNLSK
jgi:hypothetical protein